MRGKRYILAVCCFFCCVFGISLSVPAGQSRPATETAMTLEQALAAALAHNPDLQAARFNPRMAEAEMQQAGLFPNPEIEYEYENFDEPEKTLTIGYLLEPGGKRKYRRAVAATAFDRVSVELEAVRLDVIYQTAAAFIDTLMVEENLRIAREKEKLANQIHAAADQRVLAGQVSPMEAMMAEIKKNRARLEVHQAENENLIARTRLSAMWGGSAADITALAGLFEQIRPVPALESLITAMDDSPALTVKRLEIKTATNQLTLEKRNRIPDVTVSGGLKKTEEADDTVYIVGLSLPLPLFDRNQAGVARATAELEQQSAGLAAEKNRLLTALKTAHQALKTAHHQVEAIQAEILPSARKVLAAVREGYREGEFSLLDLLEAQSTLYETRESHVRSLGRYHHAVISIERLLGRDLSISVDKQSIK